MIFHFEPIDLITLILFTVILFFPYVYNRTKFIESVSIKRGKGQIDQYILFEFKPLFSVYLFHWNSSEEIDQDRFHSHAFNSICIRLSGQYTEEILTTNGRVCKTNPLIRILKRNHIHRIISAKPHSYSLVFTGPWNNTWWEYFIEQDSWTQYGSGRRVLKEQKNFPLELKN